MSPIRMLIADDHPVFRFGLRALVQTEDNMEVVGEASSGDQAVEMVGRLAPDVVLMDLNMPHGAGIQATWQICAQYPNVHVLVRTMIEDDTMVQAIQAAAKGEAIFSPEVSRRLQRYLSSATHPFPCSPNSPTASERSSP